MQNFRSLLLLLLIIAGLTACKRSDGGKDDENQAGKGGNARLNMIPQHHGIDIDSCMFYIKYGSSNLPSSFDDSVIAVPVNGRPVGTFSGLKPGNYYVYGKGYDPAILQQVVGGIPFTITEETTYDIIVPVTEEH